MDEYMECEKCVFEVTLVGYGRYGRLIANKYCRPSFMWRLAAVVDPRFSTEEGVADDLHRRCGEGVLVFSSFDAWHERYWSSTDVGRVVLDIALKPDVCCEGVETYVQGCPGLRWLILPKPVCSTRRELVELAHALAARGIRSAVASQWAYSSLPGTIGTISKQCCSEVGFVDVNFSKEGGRTYQTPPPLLELPHCIQLLQSTGFVDFSPTASPRSVIARHVEGTSDEVTVQYMLRDGSSVKVRSMLDYHPSHSERYSGSNKSRGDYQIRTMHVYDANDVQVVAADFWVHFDPTGTHVLRAGEVSCSANPDCNLEIVEDQLLNMLNAIYACMAKHYTGSVQDFDADRGVCSLEHYCHIAEEIMNIELDWERAVVQSEEA